MSSFEEAKEYLKMTQNERFPYEIECLGKKFLL